jgi:hypothetical protein
MKRLEIIQLRLAGSLPDGQLEEIRQSAANDNPPTSVSIYHRANVENDIAIHLHQEMPEADNQASNLGLRLAAALREYGMVEDTVWRDAISTERNNTEQSKRYVRRTTDVNFPT